MSIANRPEEVERLVEWVDRFGAERGLPPKVLADLQVSLDELISNVIAYAYADRAEHRIIVRLALENAVLAAQVEDDGTPFDPLGTPPPDLRGGLRERPVGRLGIPFLKALNDEFAYERVGNSNRVTLRRGVAPPQ